MNFAMPVKSVKTHLVLRLLLGSLIFEIGAFSASRHQLLADSPRQRLTAGARQAINFRHAGRSDAFERQPTSVTVKSEPEGRFRLSYDERTKQLGLTPLWETASGTYNVTIEIVSAGGDQFESALVVDVSDPRPLRKASRPPIILMNGYQPLCWGSVGGTFSDLPVLLGQSSEVLFFDNCDAKRDVFNIPPIEGIATSFHFMLSRLRYEDGTTPESFDLIAHSMGGLVARAYLAGMYLDSETQMYAFAPPQPSRIRKLITIGTPHQGASLYLLSDLASLWDSQVGQMRENSNFLWRLATWNQDGDDLRGIDSLAIVGQESPGSKHDGLVSLLSGSLFFPRIPDSQNRTRVVTACHSSCSSTKIAAVNSSDHPTWPIIESFLSGTQDWRKSGEPLAETDLQKHAGLTLGLASNDGQFLALNQAYLNGILPSFGESPAASFVDIPRKQTVLYLFGDPSGIPMDFSKVFGHGVGIFKVPPAINRVSTTNHAGNSQSVVQGGIAIIEGEGLVDAKNQVRVTLEGTLLSISEANAEKIVAKLPTGVKGLRRLKIQNDLGQHEINVLIQAAGARITSPAAGSRFSDSAVTFGWTHVPEAARYWLWIGSQRGARDLADQVSAGLSARVTGLPTDGRQVHVRLFSQVDTNDWAFEDFEYRAKDPEAVRVTASELTAPSPSTLLAASTTFAWSQGLEVVGYGLSVGLSTGATELFNGNTGTGRSITLSNLPTDGRSIHVRLTSTFSAAGGGGTESRDYVFRTQNIPRTTSLQISNRLVYPVDLFVNDDYFTRLNGSSTLARDYTLSGPNASIRLSFRMVRPTVGSTAIGDPIEGSYAAVSNPGPSITYTITNRVGDQLYFAPLVTNRTTSGGLMMVNGCALNHKLAAEEA